MINTDIAYIAGQLDADGCISVHKRPDGTLVVCVNIVSQDTDLLNWINTRFAGHVYEMGQARASQWRPSDWEAFLLVVMPYLRTKREQAELVLLYRKKTREKGKTKISRDSREFKDYVWGECARLNKQWSIRYNKISS